MCIGISNLSGEAQIGQAPIEKNVPKCVLTGIIAKMLPLQDFAALSQTSKTMHTKIALDHLWAQKRAKIIIGAEQWKKLGIETEAPPLPADIDKILKSECPYFAGKKVHQTHKLLLMPIGLSINELGRLMRHLREGDHETAFKEFSWDEIFITIGDNRVERVYWALVTTQVIPQTSGRSVAELNRLFENKEYTVSSTLEAITLLTMIEGCLKEHLLPHRPITLVRCAENIRGYPLVVEHSKRFGFSLSKPNYEPCDEDFDCVLAVRKF